ncbi:HAMP domain-containing protein [Pseudoalteromonas sp. MEBiC 03607]|uniref:HAMP domain-containing sensor histidine kinase n=1 Tax=unclassified Pseudoalteromonas TaxID=194690 RepID=UPI000C3F99FA|nr:MULTISPECIES: ATP-binding protein [unclassified Pseudoalteromonas]MBD57176.1 HAMP domain-containing histidine kinase [Pseudoalteromonas sp.]MBD58318.1 HAMP domain-containing histidine kinase [Pseudoalteromonas sp.]MCO7250064.1 ATP-binding protein [Pseudoalteromonas sp. Ps84H-4]TGV21243.1 HAMP domain-containing protein [Pseudoalteromonas sp. MEBiC 03607]TMO41366.1 HAMP domain-containing histidine kinase [Pseudoalteromonas sp. S4389]|tara:strand:+ start:3159 stop:4781 length:1623 start_codon:yes stop_codon:yes gene_type:complete
MSLFSAQTSIRKALANAVMLVTALCLSLSISISTYLDVKEQKALIVDKITLLAEIIAYNAQVTVLFDDNETEAERLKLFESVPMIKNVHIYAIDELSNKPKFFSSFNAIRTPPVPIKVNNIDELLEPQFKNKAIELIKPIVYEGNTIGYAYVRGDLERLNQYINKKIFIDILLTLFVLVIVYFVSRRIQKRIANPIDNLSNLLQDVSRNHNYETRAQKTNVDEINQLANSLNIMLARTQKQIERHENDKQEIKQLNQSLEEKVNQRTIALREANQELLNTLERMHQYQNQIVENEKMASLGQMVAGVAHEVNTPIGLGITGSTLLRDKLAEINSLFEQKTLTSSHLKRFIDDGIENLDLIYRNLNRAAELVSSFKKVAVNQDVEMSTKINLHDLLSDVIMSMRSEIQYRNPKIIINCNSNFSIETKSGPLQQVLQQLLSNSVIHGFTDDIGNEVRFDVERNESSLIIDYYDNGIGVDKSIKKRIFDPFVTTKRGEGGSGLGMHLVYNLVTQALGGTIVYDELNQEGVHFIITLPLHEGDM